MNHKLAAAAGRLGRDVAGTLGTAHQAVIRDEVAVVATLERDDLDYVLVEHVQQIFHDTFIDTTWPACPRHTRHPLWYENGSWWCTQDQVAIAPLGELASPAASAG